MIIGALLLLIGALSANAHLVTKPQGESLKAREKSQMANLYHARYVCNRGARQHKRWACKARRWLARELRQTRQVMQAARQRSWQGSARARAIAAAEEIRARGGNPWPNCPDPNDGASWDATKACESPGYGWHEDPPGDYCGPLQFDPNIWASLIRKYSIPC